MEHKDRQECIRSPAMMAQPKLLRQVIREKTMQAFAEMNLKAFDFGSKAAEGAGGM